MFLTGMRLLCFFMPFPKTLMSKVEAGKQGKMSKECVTVALHASADGHKEKPLMIEKSARPRCF